MTKFKALLPVFALSLLLGACGQQPKIVLEDSSSVLADLSTSLSFNATQESVSRGEALPVTLVLRDGQPLTRYEIELTGVNGKVTSSTHVSLTADAQGKATVKLDFLPDQSATGTAALIATSGSKVVTADLHLLLEKDQAVVTTRQVIEASYPHLVGPNMGPQSSGVRPTSLRPLIAQPQNVADSLPDVALVDDVQYLLPNGKLSEQLDGIQYRVPNTGAGQPSDADLSEKAEQGLTAQYACGTQQVSVTFNNVIDGVIRPLPKGTYIRASEQNSLTDSIQAEGWIGDNGVFSFPMQICDTGNWFSRDAPDLYFIIETRNSVGLTETHGTFARRHWWRTETWWNTSPNLVNGMTVRVSGANAEAELARRLWHKVNRVYDWNRSAMSDKYTSFPLDVLYPVSTYVGVAPLARAAIRQLQVPYGDATNDSTIHHEFGHEVYYRQMLGAAQWDTYNTATSVSFPTCGGCINHSWNTDSGPEAAMVEGWADFFEAVSTETLGLTGTSWLVETPALWSSSPPIPEGLGNETRVAAYLYDLFDNNSAEVNVEGQPSAISERTEDDAYRPIGTAAQRYRAVAGYFFNASLASELQQHWSQRIKPTLDTAGVTSHCALLTLNTLQGIDTACRPN